MERQNISFKFSKTTAKPLSGNRLNEEVLTNQEKDYVVSVDKKEIKSSLPKDKNKELIIPLNKKNDWRFKKQTNDVSEEEKKIREMAVKELLQETSEQNEKWEKREFQNFIEIIPLQNRKKENFKNDSDEPEESTLEDYENVAVEQFGLALLRGMGWKKGDPIGSSNTKSCIEAVTPHVRPKGLGLGANVTDKKKFQEKTKDENLILVKDAYVHILQGQYKGVYGQVLSLDEERVIVKLNNKEKTITIPEFSIEVISKKIYDKETSIINRESYENYKKNEQNKEKSKEKSRKRNNSNDYKIDSVHNQNSSSKATNMTQDHPKKKKCDNHINSKVSKTWIQPQLKVRFIDDKYKKGKYFNHKMTIVDVLSPENCTCLTEDDHYLENISSTMLETVIPRRDPGFVMIVQGKYMGELCTILKKDKTKCSATVQLLSDRDRALKIDYDSICEYVGDVSSFE